VPTGHVDLEKQQARQDSSKMRTARRSNLASLRAFWICRGVTSASGSASVANS